MSTTIKAIIYFLLQYRGVQELLSDHCIDLVTSDFQTDFDFSTKLNFMSCKLLWNCFLFHNCGCLLYLHVVYNWGNALVLFNGCLVYSTFKYVAFFVTTSFAEKTFVISLQNSYPYLLSFIIWTNASHYYFVENKCLHSKTAKWHCKYVGSLNTLERNPKIFPDTVYKIDCSGNKRLNALIW